MFLWHATVTHGQLGPTHTHTHTHHAALLINDNLVRFQVLIATTVKMTRTLWDRAQCSLVQVDRRFRGAYCLHNQGDGRGSTRL
jgi:hypothetical protein